MIRNYVTKSIEPELRKCSQHFSFSFDRRRQYTVECGDAIGGDDEEVDIRVVPRCAASHGAEDGAGDESRAVGAHEREHERPYDADALDKEIAAAVVDRVKHQVDSGIDIVADGEMSKVMFLDYVKDRLAGYEEDLSAFHTAESATPIFARRTG